MARAPSSGCSLLSRHFLHTVYACLENTRISVCLFVYFFSAKWLLVCFSFRVVKKMLIFFFATEGGRAMKWHIPLSKEGRLETFK